MVWTDLLASFLLHGLGFRVDRMGMSLEGRVHLLSDHTPHTLPHSLHHTDMEKYRTGSQYSENSK